MSNADIVLWVLRVHPEGLQIEKIVKRSKLSKMACFRHLRRLVREGDAEFKHGVAGSRKKTFYPVLRRKWKCKEFNYLKGVLLKANCLESSKLSKRS